jgi:hypothetical protein
MVVAVVVDLALVVVLALLIMVVGLSMAVVGVVEDKEPAQLTSMALAGFQSGVVLVVLEELILLLALMVLYPAAEVAGLL